MQVFKENSNRSKITLLNESLMGITFKPNHPGEAILYKNKSCNIGCIGCVNPRCMYFSDDEIECKIVESFPNDKSTNVCPVDAISWDYRHSFPIIDNDKCLKCGICISRCPVGALYYNRKIMVNSTSSEIENKVDAIESTIALHKQQVQQLLSTLKTGILLPESDYLLEEIYDKLFHLRHNYHNIMVRNLLIALGCNCATRRIGDVYTRMDAIYTSKSGVFGAVEIEFGKDTLDASRGILDDIAVLNTRYSIKKSENNALVVCLQLPNARQGYWQVIKDIKNVEGIEIKTITVGALMLLLWNSCCFDNSDSSYYIDYDNMNLRKKICYQLGCREINLSHKALGILEPQK